MERDLGLFPPDEIGDVLWQLLQNGDDLSSEHEVEFSTIFPSEALALKFGHLLLANNQKLSFSPYQGNDKLSWEITAYPQMALSYQNIIAYRALLEVNAEGFEGKYDGWYCASLNSVANDD